MSEIDQLNKLLSYRYATKIFDPTKKISVAEKDALISSLHLSPSSFGLQLWKFFVVEDPAVREKLKAESWGQGQVTDASHYVVLAAETNIDEVRVDRWMTCLASSQGIEPEKLSGLKEMLMGFVYSMDETQKVEWAKKQVYIALGQLMTSAALLGLDTCPLEGINPVAYDEILGINDKNYTTVVACAIGYRSSEDHHALAPKARFPLHEVVETI